VVLMLALAAGKDKSATHMAKPEGALTRQRAVVIGCPETEVSLAAHYLLHVCVHAGGRHWRYSIKDKSKNEQ
jgi:hypothetical protein